MRDLALAAACKHDHPDLLRYLIGLGADPLAELQLACGEVANVDVGDEIEVMTSGTMTPLVLTAYFGNRGNARVLLEHGADPLKVGSVGSALSTALRADQGAIVQEFFTREPCRGWGMEVRVRYLEIVWSCRSPKRAAELTPDEVVLREAA